MASDDLEGHAVDSAVIRREDLADGLASAIRPSWVHHIVTQVQAHIPTVQDREIISGMEQYRSYMKSHIFLMIPILIYLNHPFCEYAAPPPRGSLALPLCPREMFLIHFLHTVPKGYFWFPPQLIQLITL